MLNYALTTSGCHDGSQTFQDSSEFADIVVYKQKKMEKSSYQLCLSKDSRKRYEEKIAKINNVDPYLLKKSDLCAAQEFYPSVSYPDIVNYLLFAPSPITADEIKCYKSMGAYNQFLCGWVKEIAVRLFNEDSICLVVGRVSLLFI